MRSVSSNPSQLLSDRGPRGRSSGARGRLWPSRARQRVAGNWAAVPGRTGGEVRGSWGGEGRVWSRRRGVKGREKEMGVGWAEEGSVGRWAFGIDPDQAFAQLLEAKRARKEATRSGKEWWKMVSGNRTK